ncbi:redoxin domain-containing protein [Candidatus Poribacteria bacterium]|nr:redoxin domain-containing protein [Candidatus Poribacteria bacterium]
MFRRSQRIRINRDWYHFIILLTGLLLMASCVNSTLTATISDSISANRAYSEIKTDLDALSQGDGPADYDALIEKLGTFIKTYPKHRQVDEAYYFLGTILIELQRTEEGIEVLEELIKDYPFATYVEPSLLTLGLAYDKIGEHHKADALYEKLANHPKYRSGRYAVTAQQLLEQDKTERTGEISSASGASPHPSRHQFVNKLAPDFRVMDIRGEELTLEQYRGQVVLLDFWATWCGPCIAEMPNVKLAYAKHRDRNFQIIGISLDTSIAPLEAYIQGEGIEWRQYLDSTGQIGRLYGVRAIPSTFLIDGAGIVRRVNLRGLALERAVAELVRENLTN